MMARSGQPLADDLRWCRLTVNLWLLRWCPRNGQLLVGELRWYPSSGQHLMDGFGGAIGLTQEATARLTAEEFERLQARRMTS